MTKLDYWQVGIPKWSYQDKLLIEFCDIYQKYEIELK